MVRDGKSYFLLLLLFTRMLRSAREFVFCSRPLYWTLHKRCKGLPFLLVPCLTTTLRKNTHARTLLYRSRECEKMVYGGVTGESEGCDSFFTGFLINQCVSVSFND